MVWIWILSMCNFPWMSVSREADGNKGLRVSGLGERFNFCCSVLFYDLEGAEWALLRWRGFFSASLVSFEGEGPSFPWVKTPQMNVWCWGAGGPSTQKRFSVKPVWFGMLTFNHSPNSLLYTGANKLLRLGRQGHFNTAQHIYCYRMKVYSQTFIGVLRIDGISCGIGGI